MSNEYAVLFEPAANVDPVLSRQTRRHVFREFLKRALPGHRQIVLETLQRPLVYLDVDPSTGYRPYVASQHVLNTPRGDIAVGVMSEMMRREGKLSGWYTTVTTVEELLQRIAARKDLPN
jgi:hypothetical protein